MRVCRPWHLFFLILPYGTSFGFVSVAIPYVARQHGVSVEAIGALLAAAFVPHAWKFLWAPLVDSFGSRKAWYSGSLGLVAVGTFASMALPIAADSLGALTAVVVVSQLALTFLGMACEAFVGNEMAPESRRAASGWMQAGTFLGLGLGGGAAIELVGAVGGALAGAVIAAVLFACALPLPYFDETARGDRPPFERAVRELWQELWGLARSRAGFAALLVCASPIGSGAAGNLFGAMADEWRASREVVALTTGALGGLVSALGAGAGGWLAGRMNRRAAYALAGGLTAATGAAMALAPRSPATYVTFTLVYQVWNGVAYAAFSALAFETIGKGAVATKYNLLASLVNASIVYTTRVDSSAHARWGGRGVLLADAAMTTAAILVLLVIVAAARWRPRTRDERAITYPGARR